MLKGKIALITDARRPSGRFVACERVAGLVAFLCTPDSADTAGAAISIDGGWSAA